MRRWLLLYGVTCIIGQVLVLRELYVAFHGNELVYGAAMAGWFLLAAIGSGSARRIIRKWRLGVPAFGLCLAMTGLLAPATLLAIRIARWWLLGRTGVIPAFGAVFLVSFMALAPLCISLGFFYTLACTIAMRCSAGGPERDEPDRH